MASRGGPQAGPVAAAPGHLRPNDSRPNDSAAEAAAAAVAPALGLAWRTVPDVRLALATVEAFGAAACASAAAGGRGASHGPGVGYGATGGTAGGRRVAVLHQAGLRQSGPPGAFFAITPQGLVDA